MASDKDKTIRFTETSADGTTQNFTVNTNGGNFNRVKGDVIDGDYYENGKKTKKPTT